MIMKKKLWLMAIAIITVFIAIACSDKPTDANNLSAIESIEQAPGVSGQTPKPENGDKLNIDFTQDLTQFINKSFKSGGYIRNKDYSKLFYYYADVKVDSQSKPYIRVIRKYADGNIDVQGKLYSLSNETGTNYNLEVVKYKDDNFAKITAKATFTEDGKLIIKFSNYGAEIICSLTKDQPEEINIELAGNWTYGSDEQEHWRQFKVDYDGSIELLSGDIPGNDVSYTGKIDGTFSYPYIAKITCVDNDGNTHNGTIIFNSETSAEASFDAYVDLSFRPGWWGWENISRSFTRE